MEPEGSFLPFAPILSHLDPAHAAKSHFLEDPS